MHLAYRSGFILVCIYASTYLLARQFYETAEFFIVALFLAQFVFAKSSRIAELLKRNQFFQLWCAFLVLSIVVWAVVAVTQPGGFVTKLDDSRDYLRIGMVIIVGLYIASTSEKTTWLIPTLALAGALLFITFQADSALWKSILAGRRVDLGLHNAQHTGLIFGTFFLGTAIFSLRAVSATSGWRRPIVAALLVTLIAGLGWLVIGTQTRGIWLGLTVGILIASVIPVALGFSHKFLQRYGGRLISGAVIVGVVLAYGAHDIVANRVTTEKITTDKLTSALALEESAITNLSSINVRLVSWATATEWVVKRPLLGWGPRAPDDLFVQEDHLSKRFLARFGHLHNSYMEVLVAYGALGLGLYLGFYGLLAVAVVHGYRLRAIPFDVSVFFWAFLSFWAVSNFFESYILYSSGQYVQSIAFGFVYAFCVRARSKEVDLAR